MDVRNPPFWRSLGLSLSVNASAVGAREKIPGKMAGRKFLSEKTKKLKTEGRGRTRSQKKRETEEDTAKRAHGQRTFLPLAVPTRCLAGRKREGRLAVCRDRAPDRAILKEERGGHADFKGKKGGFRENHRRLWEHHRYCPCRRGASKREKERVKDKEI